MALNLNVPDAPASYYSTLIEKEIYTLRFKWNTRGESWYLDISTKDGTLLASSSKLVPNTPLIRQNKDKGPAGNFYVISTTTDVTSIPTRNNLGQGLDFELYYISDEELANVS